MSCVKRLGSDCLCEHLGSANVRALYLSDALETGNVEEIISALIDIRRAIGGQKVVDLNPLDMRLSDVLDIMNRASLQFTAVSRE